MALSEASSGTSSFAEMSMRRVFLANASDGGLKWDSPSDVAGALQRVDGRRLRVTIEPWSQTRSLRANNFYFGVVIPAVTEVLWRSTGKLYRKDAVHDFLVRAFLGVDKTPLGEVAMPTHDMTSDDFNAYVQRIVAWAAQEWGEVIE